MSDETEQDDDTAQRWCCDDPELVSFPLRKTKRPGRDEREGYWACENCGTTELTGTPE